MIEIGDKEIKNSEKLFQVIYNDSPIGIEIYNSNGKLIDLNQSCMELFGISRKEDVKGFDLLDDPNIPKNFLTKLKRRETIRYESTFDFDLVKKHNLYKTSKSGKIYINVLITPLFLKENKSISNYLVQVQDISDRKIAEHRLIDLNMELEKRVQKKAIELKKSEANWRVLVEEAPDIIITVDRNGDILYINKVTLRKTREETIGTNVLDYISPEYHEIVKNSIEKVFQTGELGYYEISARGPNNSTVWYSIRFGAIKEEKEVISVMLLARDITDKKKAEQKLRDSEEKYRLFVENFQGITFRGHQNFSAAFFHGAAEDITGYTEDDFISGHIVWDQLIHPEDLPKVQEEVKQFHSRRIRSTSREYRIIDKKGKIHWVLESIQKVWDDLGKEEVVHGQIYDITNRKEAEIKLKESEEKFRMIMDQSLMGIAILQDGLVKYASERMTDIYGYSVEEWLNFKPNEFLRLIDSESLDIVREQAIKKQLGHEDVITHYEVKIIKKTGEKRWVENYSKTINYKGKPADLVANIDITERKETELALKESEEKYRTLVDSISDIIFEIDLDGKITYLSPQTFDMLGYKPEELVNRNAFKFIDRDDQEEVLKNQDFVINSGEVGSVEFRIRHKDGHNITVSSRSQLIEKDGKKEIIGLFRDVTKRKKIEKKVQEEKEKSEMYLNLVNVLIIALDKDGTILMINKKGNDILGWKQGELIGKNWFENCIPQDDRERVHDYFKKLMKGKVDIVPFYENAVITNNGDEKLIAWSTILFKDYDGKITGLLSSGEDITARKKTEDALRESEEKFRTIAEQSLMGIIILQDNLIKYINSAAANMLGYTIEEILNIPLGGFINFIHPDYRNIVIEQAKKRQKGIKTQITGFEHQALKKNGEIIWIQNYSKTISYQGKLGDLITVIDISDRKRAELKLKQSEQELIRKNLEINTIFNTIPAMLNVVDREYNVINISDAFAKAFHNGKKESAIGKKCYQAHKQRNNICSECTVEEVFKTGKIETRLSTPDEEAKTGKALKIYSAPLKDTNGNITGAVEAIMDITDIKKAEEKIRESEKKLVNLIESVPVGISITTLEGKILECNSQAFQIFGYSSKEEYLTVPVINVYKNPSDREKFLELHEKGVVKDFEVEFKRKNGSVFWASLTSVTYRDGDQTTFINSFQDITERKESEIKIQQSEAELTAIYNYTPIAILLLDNERRIRKINKFALKFTDRNEEEVFGIHGGEALRCLYSIKDPRGCGFSDQCQECVIRNTVLDTFKLKIPHINVEATLHLLPSSEFNKVHLLFSTVPLNLDGEDRVLVSIIDITERIKATQKLKESEKKYRKLSSRYEMLLESITDGVYALNRDWEYILVNKNAERLINMPIEKLLGNKIFEVFPGIEQTPFFKVYDNVMKTRSTERVIDSFKLPDGHIGYYEVNVYPIKEGILCIGKDVTEEKQIEQKLKQSEERFKYLVSSSPSIIYTSKTSGDYGATFISDNVEEKWGYDPQLFVNNSEFWIEHVHPDDKDYVLEVLSDLFEKEQIIYDYRFKINDGTYHWMRDEGLLVRDVHGNPIEIIGSVIDITYRVEAEQRLKESEEKFRTIAEQSALGILIQQNGNIKFVNKAFSEMIEYSLEEINNWTVKEIMEIIHEEDYDFVREKFQEHEERNYNKTIYYECRVVTRKRKIKWLEVTSKPIDYLGKYSILISVIDITVRKKVERELKEISRLKSDLLSRTSHELKTPLVSIKGYTDLLLSQHYEMLDIYTISVLNEIKQGCYRLESLIKDLLETSKLESEEIQLIKSEEDLEFLIRFCIRDLRGLIETRNHDLILDIQKNLITMMEKERIYEVIMNLLSNAIKYTPPNGQILIKSVIKDDIYIISVNDNGIGLTEDEKEKIFKKFGKIERYGKGMDVVSEGSGLGLYISKKIIDLHGGEIWVESEGRDKGSTFYFSLPIIKK